MIKLLFVNSPAISERNFVYHFVKRLGKFHLDALKTPASRTVSHYRNFAESRVSNIFVPYPHRVVTHRLAVRHYGPCLWVSVVIWIHNQDCDVFFSAHF